MKEPEIWKAIEGFEGLYEVSNLGRVKSTHRASKILKYGFSGGRGINRYPTVNLRKYGHAKNGLIHRLVAIAFLDNPKNKREVNHKDGNKLNNHVDNLEWCTRKENCAHSSQSGLLMRDGVHYNAKLTMDEVVQIKRQLANGVKQCFLVKEFNSDSSTINSISRGKSWKHVTI